MTDQPAAPLLHGRAFLHREIVLLILLSALGVAAFLGTKAFADSNAAMRHRDGEVWYARGRDALAAGNTPAALEALQRAARINPADCDVSFTLATALRTARDPDRAAQVLGALRELRPDDPDPNLELARLESARGNFQLATRYYQDALDGLWMPEAADRSRRVRTEFIHALLDHGQRGRALAQTLVLAANLPADAATQIDVGQLFLASGDPRRALDRFSAALTADPGNPVALAGAGEASFTLGDYTRARRDLTASASTDPRITEMREAASLVLTADPLAPRVGRAERDWRVARILEHATARLDACAPADSDTDPARRTLRESIDALAAPASRRMGQDDDRDRAEDAVEAALRVEQATGACGAGDALGRAVALIARTHGLEGQR